MNYFEIGAYNTTQYPLFLEMGTHYKALKFFHLKKFWHRSRNWKEKLFTKGLINRFSKYWFLLETWRGKLFLPLIFPQQQAFWSINPALFTVNPLESHFCENSSFAFLGISPFGCRIYTNRLIRSFSRSSPPVQFGTSHFAGVILNLEVNW